MLGRMKIVIWNVNSINARLGHVKRYLREAAPDALMIQELKTENFPAQDFENLGYRSQSIGQKAYNGVAILAKTPVETVLDRLPGEEEEDAQARYLEANVNGLRLINIYAPNGNPAPGEKFDYKLRWMKRLTARLRELLGADQAFIVGGDFNIIPEEKDCLDPNAWKEDALFRIESRQALRTLENMGLYDAFRIFDTRAAQYTFWDYQAGAWQRNNGIRIDHFLLSPAMADRVQSCVINRDPRGWDKPSDHTCVELEISLNNSG